MKKCCSLVVVFFLFPFLLPAQDTLADLPVGVIYVKKPSILPYVKVEYSLFLTKPMKVATMVPVTDSATGYTDMETDTMHLFDSSANASRLHLVYPPKNTLFSKYYVTQLNYRYIPSDTPRVDTFCVGMWIGKNGKVREVFPDTISTVKTDSRLAGELTSISKSIRNWGTPGGYMTPKRFLHRPKFIASDYYCEMFVIVSSGPLTVEQKNTNAAYAPFDIPLNTPPDDSTEEKFIQENTAVNQSPAPK